jgi:hypothetical protein
MIRIASSSFVYRGAKKWRSHHVPYLLAMMHNVHLMVCTLDSIVRQVIHLWQLNDFYTIERAAHIHRTKLHHNGITIVANVCAHHATLG